MARITTTEQQRYALFTLLNPMTHATRAERKKVDTLWDALKLDDVANKAVGTPIDTKETREDEITSDQRDLIIEILSRPGITTGIGRVLNPVEKELIRSRDGGE